MAVNRIVISKGLRDNIQRGVKWKPWRQTADIRWALRDSAKRICPFNVTNGLH